MRPKELEEGKEMIDRDCTFHSSTSAGKNGGLKRLVLVTYVSQINVFDPSIFELSTFESGVFVNSKDTSNCCFANLQMDELRDKIT